MRSLPDVCGFPTSSEVMTALKRYQTSSTSPVRVSDFVSVMKARASSHRGGVKAALDEIGANPFAELAGSGGGVKTVGTFIDVICSRNKKTKESFTKAEMKLWEETAGFHLGGSNGSYDPAQVYSRSVAALK